MAFAVRSLALDTVMVPAVPAKNALLLFVHVVGAPTPVASFQFAVVEMFHVPLPPRPRLAPLVSQYRSAPRIEVRVPKQRMAAAKRDFTCINRSHKVALPCTVVAATRDDVPGQAL